MAKYRALSNESVFDIAAKLYNDTPLGISDILTLNKDIDINSELVGSDIEYTAGLTRKRPVINVPFTAAQRTYRSNELQSHYDLVVQLYGDMSHIGEILKSITDINGNIALGTVFKLPEQTDPQAIFFNDKIVATDIVIQVVGNVTFDSTIITWDSTEFTFDQT